MQRVVFFVCIFCCCFFCSQAQNIGIGTANPDSSAQLDVSSTIRGFLPPRMSQAQRNVIINPASGLIVYCTDCGGGIGEMNFYNGRAWVNMTLGVTSNVVADLPSVTIGNNVWTSQNLSVSCYRNGDIIPQITDPLVWTSLTTGAWCWYNNDSANYWQYGKLYNWYAVNDSRSLAPLNWHIPSDAEWNQLVKFIDPNADIYGPNLQSNIAGGVLKEIGTSHWASPNTDASNSSGFTALPGGCRGYNGGFFGAFVSGYWWTSTSSSTTTSYVHGLFANAAGEISSEDRKFSGYSVRLVRN